MKFFKLDTGQLRGFDNTLAPEIQSFDTGSTAVLRRLAHHKGWVTTIGCLLRALFVQPPGDRALVEGNITRKQIRLPSLFGSRLVSGIYRWIKTAQAILLKEALQDELQKANPEIVIVYNGSVYPEAVLAHVSEKNRRVFVESGFFPGTLQIDPKGLNGANSVPRDPNFYLDTSEDFAAKGRPHSVNNRQSKSNSEGEVTLPQGYVFVPFQVPSDMQVTVHSPWIRDMEMFLDAVIAAADRNPDDVFVIKEHPSFKRSVKGLRPDHPRVIFANSNVTSELIQNARAVITLNSTVGIEALLFEKPVITLGRACYNIEGLVLHAETAGALDTALGASRNWAPDDRLRRQFLGYLWNYYLVPGRYDDLPDDLQPRIEQISG
jgi:capsular polysaccharide export protein